CLPTRLKITNSSQISNSHISYNAIRPGSKQILPRQAPYITSLPHTGPEAAGAYPASRSLAAT
ncbi:MAG TPA: hypothetical protein VJ036_05050, partial [bacterium]|nr:hypothetical protein [bacterium]